MCLLELDLRYSVNFLLRRMLITYRRFGRTYRSHVQGPILLGQLDHLRWEG